LIVIPARVTRRKNIEMGIEVAAELRKTYPSVRVIITGPLGAHNNDNRTYFDELRALRAARSLEQEVFFCAERDIRLEHSSVMQLLRASDLVFLPSFEEGFGIPLLEAAAMRTPVACSDIPVFREVTGGLAHFFNPHGSAHEAVATIEQALSSIPSLTYRKIRGEFSWEAVYASHLHSIIQKPR
jgi:glycosyltransferase involved in cell wall biosynthesis